MNTFHYFREATVNGRMFFLSHTIPDRDKMLDFEGSHKDIFFKDKPEYEYYFLTSVPEYEKNILKTDTLLPVIFQQDILTKILLEESIARTGISLLTAVPSLEVHWAVSVWIH